MKYNDSGERELLKASFAVSGLNPNTDTLYNAAWLNLTAGPLVFQVPPIPDRYYTLEFNDAYGSTFYMLDRALQV